MAWRALNQLLPPVVAPPGTPPVPIKGCDPHCFSLHLRLLFFPTLWAWAPPPSLHRRRSVTTRPPELRWGPQKDPMCSPLSFRPPPVSSGAPEWPEVLLQWACHRIPAPSYLRQPASPQWTRAASPGPRVVDLVHGFSGWRKFLKFVKSRKSCTEPPGLVINCTTVPKSL
jgi:hypothetical protein